MRIHTNVSAALAGRHLRTAEVSLTRQVERLSSGLRINGARDDAAALTLSQKLRSQVRGAAQGQRNGQEGISMIQTADGALGEVQSMLQRMRELSLRASSSALTSADRASINDELKVLKSGINDISQRTTWNDKQLLSGAHRVVGSTSTPTLDPGSEVKAGTTLTRAGAPGQITNIDGLHLGGGDVNFLKGRTFTVSAGGGNTLQLSTAGAPTASATVNDLGANQTQSITWLVDDGAGGTHQVRVDIQAGADGLLASEIISQLTTPTNNEIKFDLLGVVVAADSEIQELEPLAATPTINVTSVGVSTAAPNQTHTFSSSGPGSLTLTRGDGAWQTIAVGNLAANGTGTLSFSSLGIDVNLQADMRGATAADIIAGLTAPATNEVRTGALSTPASGGVTLQVGPNGTNAIVVGFDQVDITATSPAAMQALHNALTTFDLQLATGSAMDAAQSLIGALDGAIGYVSGVRSYLGAMQNRVQFAISNVGVVEENMLAAGSRITDADMANEAVGLMRTQSLSGFGMAFLAQTNRHTEIVLSLLR